MNANFAMFATIAGGAALRQLWILFIIGLVLGIFAYLIKKAPFLDELWRTILLWLITLVGALVLINFLLNLIEYPIIKF